MKPTEAAALLTMAAAFDNRKPDADAAKAWAAALDGLRFEDCRDALIAHFRTSSDWLMPNKIISEVKRIRHQRVRAFGALPSPPRHIDPDNTAELTAWEIQTTRDIADGTLTTDNPQPIGGNRGPWDDNITPLEAAADASARVREIKATLARRPTEPDRPTLTELAAPAVRAYEDRATTSPPPPDEGTREPSKAPTGASEMEER